MREDEMVAAILADPDNTVPRVVYADWLQSQGDPHGEHIALLLAAEHLALHDPKLTAIWTRVKELDCFPFARFRQYTSSERGLVSRLSLQCRDLSLLGDLRGTLVRDLAIGSGRLEAAELDILHQASRAMRLRELRLEPYASEAVLAEILTWFPDLETLYIGKTIIDDAYARMLANAALPKLARLTVVATDRTDDPRFMGDAGAEALAGLRQLRELALIGWRIGERGATALVRLPLTALDLTGNPLGRAGIEALLATPLQSLAIAGTGLDDSIAVALANAPALASLRRLVLGADQFTSGLTATGIATLIASPHLSRELALHIDGGALGMQADVAIDGASGLPSWSNWVGEIPAELGARFHVTVTGHPPY